VEREAAAERRADPPRTAGRIAAVAVGFLLLLAVVAVASGARGRGSIEAAPRGVPPALFDYLFTLGVVLAGVAVAAMLLLRPRFTPPERDPTGFFRLVLAMAFFAAFGYVALRLGLDAERRAVLEELLERREGQGEPTGVADREGGQQVRFRWEVVVLGAVAVAAIAVVAARRQLARRRPSGSRRAAAERLAELLEVTVEDLRRERDARRAVIAAYARMEQALALHGTPRRPSEAPLEYLGRALRELDVPAEAALDLTALFERAKFSLHPIDAGMKDEAISALVTVRDELREAA
jgi:hypothetical protein